VQGRLRNQKLEVTIETACGHCGETMHIHMDQDMNYQFQADNAQPMVFEPHIDWDNFMEPNILDAY
jgi:hypothetical protein